MYVGFIFSALALGQLPFIAFPRQLVDAGLCDGVKAQVDQFAGHVGRKNTSDGIEQTIQNGCTASGRFTRCPSPTRCKNDRS